MKFDCKKTCTPAQAKRSMSHIQGNTGSVKQDVHLHYIYTDQIDKTNGKDMHPSSGEEGISCIQVNQDTTQSNPACFSRILAVSKKAIPNQTQEKISQEDIKVFSSNQAGKRRSQGNEYNLINLQKKNRSTQESSCLAL